MFKRVFAIVLLALVVVSACSLTACGSKGLPDGTYKLVSMTEDGVENNDLSQLESYGMSVDLVVNGDKATLAGQELSVKGYTLVKEGQTPVPFSYDGKTVTIEQDGIKMVFEKAS